MEWLKSMQGEVVGMDAAPLIYFIEENPTYPDIVLPFHCVRSR